MIELAFTTRIPLAVMIAMGIKRWENRNAMPSPAGGRCAMTCSKSSDAGEYARFRTWAGIRFPGWLCERLPAWERVSGWRGRLVAVCDYDAGYAPGERMWDEGYPVWWRLSNVRLLPEPISCRGNVGMWILSKELSGLLPGDDARS